MQFTLAIFILYVGFEGLDGIEKNVQNFVGQVFIPVNLKPCHRDPDMCRNAVSILIL